MQRGAGVITVGEGFGWSDMRANSSNPAGMNLNLNLSCVRLWKGPLAMAAVLGLAVISAQARINVTGLPGRSTVQLTIYNSVDLTLVKETRVLTFAKGVNRLEFSWANTLIDPTSVELRALTRADEVEVLDVRFPPRVTNTLEWRIQSEAAGEVRMEIRYFTSGITWGADYVSEADQTEKQMRLAGSVRIQNQSGEDYENAQVRLVVGIIRLVERIADLAHRAADMPVPVDKRDTAWFESRTKGAEKLKDMDGMKAAEDPRAIQKEGLSEYFLYTVAGRGDVPHGWAKRLPSLNAEGVPIVSYYKYEKERFGDAVMRYYKFKNDEAGKLGKEPLPDGAVVAFRTVGPEKLYAFMGRTAVKYIPIGEEVELELGHDSELLVKPRLMNWEKDDVRFGQGGNVSGWTTRETWQVELQNSKSIAAVVDVRRNFAGDWEMASNDAHEKVDATKVKFVVPLVPGAKRTLAYTLTVRHGVNARR